MKIPELIDSLIELSTHEMPKEARECLDDAIDHMVSSLTDNEMNELFQKGLAKTDLIPIKDKTLDIGEPYVREYPTEYDTYYLETLKRSE